MTPNLDVAGTPATLVKEAIDASYSCSFVIPSEKEEGFGMTDLVQQQEQDALDALTSSVDIVAKEEVVGIRGESRHVEETQQIMKLSMNVTDDLDRCADFEQHGLVQKDVSRCLGNFYNLGIADGWLFGKMALVPGLEETLNASIDV